MWWLMVGVPLVNCLKTNNTGPCSDQSILFQVLAWWRQATSHYLSQCSPNYISPYGVPKTDKRNELNPRSSLFCITAYLCCRDRMASRVLLELRVNPALTIKEPLVAELVRPVQPVLPVDKVQPARQVLRDHRAQRVVSSCQSNCELRIEVIWWRHQMETWSALLAICARNSPVNGEFPAQRPVTRSFDVFFDLRLNERLIKQSWSHGVHHGVTVMRSENGNAFSITGHF